MHRFIVALSRLLLACVLVLPVLTACEKPTLGVSLHGVNYSADIVSFMISPLGATEHASGSGTIDPFGGGGMTCCVTLPRQWRPGIKLQIRATHWVDKRAENSIEEITSEHIAEVPRYADGKPGELWVLREADGKISVVSSDYQPDHPKWPGRIKGWPVPSLEYRRERWDLLRAHEQGYVDTFTKLLDELEQDPSARGKEAWAHDMEYDPKSLGEFTGPEDPRYLAVLKQEYMGGLISSRGRLATLMEQKP